MIDSQLDKKKILQQVSFGKRIAEEESSELAGYFVETDQWERIIGGEVDIVYGAKGTGKSAIYSLMLQKEDYLLDCGTVITSAERPQGAPAFKSLESHDDISERELGNLWKLYFLSLLGMVFRDYGIDNSGAKLVIKQLEKAGLMQRKFSLSRLLSSSLDYVKRLAAWEAAETELKYDPAGNVTGVVGRIVFKEPDSYQADQGFHSIDELLDDANNALDNYGYDVWILLDRLDVAFAENMALESKALRALFKVYLDFAAYKNIVLKIFIRDDIWERIVADGFREASHITRSLTIDWDSTGLMNLVIRRFLSNNVIVDLYDCNIAEILSDIIKQQDLYYSAFPDQVDVGQKKGTSFDWMLSRIRDGNGIHAPRELIHLLEEAKRAEIDRIEVGDLDISGVRLFSEKSFKTAHEEVSRERLNKTIFAEYSDMKKWILELSEQKTEQFLKTLSELWSVSEDEALSIANRLIEIGFFQKRESKGEASYWVPFIYRPALDMVQGKAS
ncbi:P-loop ATPase, Sll1717 family [Halomonas salinarum]|uniref:P-loop ATPase, Sll1717 family n=1 Tax=Halomonas salinarum TaxID=1158993 RepID=UPI00143A1614|nr:hypothetical protein [Halomonas salinarum]